MVLRLTPKRRASSLMLAPGLRARVTSSMHCSFTVWVLQGMSFSVGWDGVSVTHLFAHVLPICPVHTSPAGKGDFHEKMFAFLSWKPGRWHEATKGKNTYSSSLACFVLPVNALTPYPFLATCAVPLPQAGDGFPFVSIVIEMGRYLWPLDGNQYLRRLVRTQYLRRLGYNALSSLIIL